MAEETSMVISYSEIMDFRPEGAMYHTNDTLKYLRKAVSSVYPLMAPMLPKHELIFSYEGRTAYMHSTTIRMRTTGNIEKGWLDFKVTLERAKIGWWLPGMAEPMVLKYQLDANGQLPDTFNWDTVYNVLDKLNAVA